MPSRTWTFLLLGLLTSVGTVWAQDIAGIGVALKKEGKGLFIQAIVPESAAASSQSLAVGDQILAIAQDHLPEVPTEELSIAQAVALIRGPKSSTVRLTIRTAADPDGPLRVVSLQRGVLAVLARWGDGKALPVGSQAPNIEWTCLPGKAKETLKQHRGRIVVLEFWATWCLPCQKSMSDLQALVQAHPAWNDRVVIMALSVDDEPAPAVRHAQAKGWNQTPQAWVGTEAIKAYHINGIPMCYVIDQAGRIAAAGHELDLKPILDQLLESSRN
jgi:thiol-disulfide isomerase/thioredoxin